MKNKNIIVTVLLIVGAFSLSACSLMGANRSGGILPPGKNRSGGILPPGKQDASPTEDATLPVSIYDVLGPGLHTMRNPENYSQIVFDENGKMIDKTIDSELEAIGLIENVDLGYANYYYKADFTAEVATTSYVSSTNMDEVFEDLMPIQKSKLYDKNGKEIKLPIDFSTTVFAVADNIFLRDADKNYYENNLVRVYKNADGTWGADTDNIYGNTVRYKEFNGANGKYINLYFSSELYDEGVTPRKVVITDVDLIIEKEYEGYNLDNIMDLKGKRIVQLVRSENDKLKFNFLDDNNELVFDTDVDKGIPYDSKTRVVTLKRDDKEFDFDFDTYTVVGDEREYVEKEKGDPTYLYKEKYDEIKDKITGSDSKYDWATTWYDEINKKLRILAYYNETFNDNTGYTQDADVYDEEGKFIGTIPKFSACYEESGLFFYNNNTVCDFDLNTIKTFEEDMYLSRVDKFDRMFFIERFSVMDSNERKDISDIKTFKIYDKDFNVLYDNLIAVYEYTMEDYLIMVDKDSTKFVTSDKDGNLFVKKEINRPLDVSNWYSESDNKTFMDMKTGFYGILDKDLNIIIDNMKNIVDLKEKYFTFEKGFKYGLMNYEGREILSFSIFDYIKE